MDLGRGLLAGEIRLWQDIDLKQWGVDGDYGEVIERLWRDVGMA